ncbi:hypothetical protein ACK1KB_04015 [Chryseobacterium sp. TY3]
MKIIIKTAFFFILTLVSSCGSSGIQDGKYCADIEVHNWKTDKDSYYTLPVEVYNNRIIKIYWANGGWLDETHFNIDEAKLDTNDKTALFEDDRERMFLVKILENDYCN